jgi:hypothetical protein
MGTWILLLLKHLANVLVFSATLLYVAIVFWGFSIPSHVYHDLHKLFKLLLSLGLVLTSLYSCDSGGILGISDDFTRLHCQVSSKFGLVAGILLLVVSLVDIYSVEWDHNKDGLFAYQDFSAMVDTITGGSITEASKSNIFDLLGGDYSQHLTATSLPGLFFPLA